MQKMTDTLFSQLSDDIVLNIFSKLEGDPRNWARLACVCTKFSSLIRTICWKSKCSSLIPSVVADLGSSVPPGGWSSLFKLSVCCPGLLHAGVLLENSDFGLERELGPDENYPRLNSDSQSNFDSSFSTDACSSQCGRSNDNNGGDNRNLDAGGMANECSWSLFDDLYYDTMYNASEAHDDDAGVGGDEGGGDGALNAENGNRREVVIKVGRERDFNVCKRRKISRSMRSHLASGTWNLSREQGIKLLASRFRGDSLYICDWPGCLHIESKRNYMLFRGIFKNFKRSRVWRTINDGNRSKIDLNCAFCSCKETWDLHSAFCLRRVFGFHDDGEPVVRAYVCENGHVSGAWTDLPLYT